MRLPSIPRMPNLLQTPIMKEDSFEKCCLMIYRSFIEIGSMFEINISGVMRNRIINNEHLQNILQCEAGDIEIRLEYESQNEMNLELLNIFDEAASEMMSLLNQSFLRFTDTKEFQNLVNSMYKM